MDDLKILYACSNSIGSKIQLERFVKAIKGKPYKLKIAAYKKSSPENVSIDWTLDCLSNIFDPEWNHIDNENFDIYFEQVKSFNPDLVISDLEYFTSYIANFLNVTVWQCSSSLLKFALSHEQKYKLGLHKKYSYLMNINCGEYKRILNLIDTSNHNLICSHLGDIDNNIRLKSNFDWIRPYHTIGKKAITCEHNIVAGMLKPSKNIINLLRLHEDSVIFSEDLSEQYPNILLKELKNQIEYTCNLYNSNLFVCDGQTNFLADAFYNSKFSLVMPNFHDVECVINSVVSEHFGFSKTIYYDSEDVGQYMLKPIEITYNDKIKLLHEKIDLL